MIIANFKKSAKNSLSDRQTGLREKALQIAGAGYEEIEIEKIVSKRISFKNNALKITHIFSENEKEININLENFNRVFAIGIGKGSATASMTLAKILGEKLSGGIALDIQKPKLEIRNCLPADRRGKLEIYQGAHPLPSKQNIIATQEIIKLVKSLTEKDLLITFICGGGSALACASEEELKNSVLAIKELTKVGATIEELNIIRKHLSEFKGGGLAKMAYPATVISLIVSDVCGNDLSTVASGPTVFDKTTRKDADKILKKYQLPITDYQLYETPKEKKYFQKIKNILFVCNQDAITGMIKKAKELGFVAKIYSLALEGEAKIALTPMIKDIKKGEAIIAAGETTVILENQKLKVKSQNYNKIKNFIKGGRNQEAVLGAIANNLITDNLVFMSFASDAYDNIEAAGAIGDFLTLEKAKKLKLNPQEFLDNHNSFNFFKKTGDLIYAEQKCFNVADLMLVLKL